MENEFVLTKLERQLLVFDVISHCEVTEYVEITSLIPISTRTIQRDVKDLTDAGLIRVEFSKKENGYVHIGEPELNPSIPDGKKKKHLQDLYRLGTLMWNLTSSPEDLAEEKEIDLELEYGEGESFLTEEKKTKQRYTAVDSYCELFPGASEKDWKRDFEILSRIGYGFYCTGSGNHYTDEMFGNVYLRENFGVRMREDGKLVKKEER